MYWTSSERGIPPRMDERRAREFYRSSVDRREYPEFDDWIWDMERSAVLFRHVPGLDECPSCGSPNAGGDLVGESRTLEHSHEHYDMSCPDCGAEWLLHCWDGEWEIQPINDDEEV